MEGYQRIKMIIEFSGKPITSSDANAINIHVIWIWRIEWLQFLPSLPASVH